MKYTVIVDPNTFDPQIAGIHKTGCADIPKTHGYAVTVEGTLRDALDVAVDPDDRELGYDDSDAKVFPCAL